MSPGTAIFIGGLIAAYLVRDISGWLSFCAALAAITGGYTSRVIGFFIWQGYTPKEFAEQNNMLGLINMLSFVTVVGLLGIGIFDVFD